MRSLAAGPSRIKCHSCASLQQSLNVQPPDDCSQSVSWARGGEGVGEAEPGGEQGVRQSDAAVSLSGAPSVPPLLTGETGGGSGGDTRTDSSALVPKHRNLCRSLISE